MTTQPSAQTGATPDANEASRVVVFDTTMRDGEQSPGASMSHDEKLELAKILEEMGVDVIEAGFPIASNGDFEAVKAISQIVTESTVCGLSRAGPAGSPRRSARCPWRWRGPGRRRRTPSPAGRCG